MGFLYEWNGNGRFSARLGLDKLMPGGKIENVVFLGKTEIFEERKHKAFFTFTEAYLYAKVGRI